MRLCVLEDTLGENHSFAVAEMFDVIIHPRERLARLDLNLWRLFEPIICSVYK